MTLESIVPSLADCKRIPEGAFTESALVYVHFGFSCQEYGVACRDNCHHADVIIPAPTLAEILAELPNGVHVFRDIVAYPLYGLKYENENLATAALLLWLELKGVQG